MLEHDDLVDVVDRSETMGNDESRSAAHEFFDRLHDGSFGGGIERGGRFVEKQDRRVLQKCARNADALPLADAKMAAASAHGIIVGAGKIPDEFVRLGAARRDT